MGVSSSLRKRVLEKLPDFKTRKGMRAKKVNPPKQRRRFGDVDLDKLIERLGKEKEIEVSSASFASALREELLKKGVGINLKPIFGSKKVKIYRVK